MLKSVKNIQFLPEILDFMVISTIWLTRATIPILFLVYLFAKWALRLFNHNSGPEMLSARSKIGELCNIAFPLKTVNSFSAKRAKIDGACGPLIVQLYKILTDNDKIQKILCIFIWGPISQFCRKNCTKMRPNLFFKNKHCL